MRQSARLSLGLTLCTVAALHAAPPTDTMPSTQPMTTETRSAAVLSAPLGDLRFTGVALETVIDQIRDSSEQMIFVNWRNLADHGFARSLPVTIDLSRQTLGQAMTRLADELSQGAATKVGFEIEDDVITFSTADDLNNIYGIATRTYDVGPALGIDDDGRAQRVESLLRRVRGIQPMTWRSNGGRVGIVRELGGQLIVTQTPAVHARIVSELGDDIVPQHTRPILLPQTLDAPVRSTAPATEPANTSPLVRTQRALSKQGFDEIRLEKATFAEAVASISKQAAVQIDVEWAALEKVGVSATTPIELRFRNVKSDKVIRSILEQASQKSGHAASADQLMCTVLADGRVVVATRAAIFNRLAVKADYPVGVLFALSTPANRSQLEKSLGDLIRQATSVGLWADEAGAPAGPGGSLAFDGDVLHVTQTDDGQEQVAGLLRSLRRSTKAETTQPAKP